MISRGCGVEGGGSDIDAVSLWFTVTGVSGGTADSLPSLTDPLPSNVLPLVLVGVFDTSSQSDMSPFSFRTLKRSVSEGFLSAVVDCKIGAEICSGVVCEAVEPPCDEKSLFAVSHFFTPSRL